MSVDFQVNFARKAGPRFMKLSPIPHLENGDHLTKDEISRRYNAMPIPRKAEFATLREVES
jgi:hypothetical protein